jgi:hypothetical protein
VSCPEHARTPGMPICTLCDAYMCDGGACGGGMQYVVDADGTQLAAHCVECDELVCWRCGGVSFCDVCGKSRCLECERITFCDGCGSGWCVDCAPETTVEVHCDGCGTCWCGDCAPESMVVLCDGCGSCWCGDCVPDTMLPCDVCGGTLRGATLYVAGLRRL